MAERLRVGIISANWGAQAHLPAWRSLEGVEVVGICTSRPETARAAADRYGIERPYHDYREMAATKDIDLIDVGTRPPLRYHMVSAAIANGKHVYQGIPFAASLADARDMDRQRREAGVVAAVDAFAQAVPAMVHLKELVDGGELGEIFGVRVSVDLSMFTQGRTNVPDYVWFADPANGTSVLRNFGSHVLHPLVHIFGPIRSVYSDQSVRLRQWDVEGGDPITPRVPDTAFVVVTFESGLTAQISCVWSMIDGEGFRMDVWGSKKRVQATAQFLPQAYDTRLFISENAPMGVRSQQELVVPERLKAIPGCTLHADEFKVGQFPMASVFDSIREEIAGRGKAAPDFEQALHVHEVLEAAEIAAREGRRVDLAELPA